MGYVDSHTHIWFKEVLDKDSLEVIVNVLGNNWLNWVSSPEEIIKVMDLAEINYVVIIAYPSRRLWKTKEDFPVKLARFLSRYRDRFSVVGGIEPQVLNEGEAKYWLERQFEAGVSGFKLHPPHMWIKPNAYREEEGGNKTLELLYSFSEENDLPVVFHTGTSNFPTSRNKYGDPIFIDDVSLDFPKLSIVMAHAGRPNWVSTAFQLARIRENVFLDLSSIPPKKVLEYIPRLSVISSKCVYGSDFPDREVKGLRENLQEFLKIQIPRGELEKIVSLNARSIFKTIG